MTHESFDVGGAETVVAPMVPSEGFSATQLSGSRAAHGSDFPLPGLEAAGEPVDDALGRVGELSA
jgi:hypothetical protein